MAFVWIAAAAKDEMPDFTVPECVFGVAHPGLPPRAANPWNAARHGVWHALDTWSVAPTGWSQGKFPQNKGQFGTGGFWHARRVPLAHLVDEASIGELVTRQLRDKYAEVFLAGATPQVAARV